MRQAQSHKDPILIEINDRIRTNRSTNPFRACSPGISKAQRESLVLPSSPKGSYQRKLSEYRRQRVQWQSEQEHYQRKETQRATLYQRAAHSSLSSMKSVLDDHLMDIDLLQKTILPFELSDDGKTLMLDSDLPQIEDFPKTKLRIYQRDIGASG